MLMTADSAIYLSTLLTLVLALQISQQASSLLQLIGLASASWKRESNKQRNILFPKQKTPLSSSNSFWLYWARAGNSLERKFLEVFTFRELKPVSAKPLSLPHTCASFSWPFSSKRGAESPRQHFSCMWFLTLQDVEVYFTKRNQILSPSHQVSCPKANQLGSGTKLFNNKTWSHHCQMMSKIDLTSSTLSINSHLDRAWKSSKED